MSKFCTEFIIHNLYRICTDNQNAEILIGKLSIISVRIIKLPFFGNLCYTRWQNAF